MNSLILFIKRPVIGLILCLAFLSCSPSNKQKENIENPEKKEFRVAIELILENEEDQDSLMTFLDHSTALEVYHWKNHVVFWGAPEDTFGISKLIKQAPVNLSTKIYSDPFYAFDINTHCSNANKAQEWKNYLLTANLVKEPSLQQEYMDYHNDQFQEWPEVSQGFCNAEFQQLLLFRNGRQLMLVISVPADKTLDELNPRTTKNNPRVDEWNALMSKYQEGIAGTDEGEVWVFLEPY